MELIRFIAAFLLVSYALLRVADPCIEAWGCFLCFCNRRDCSKGVNYGSCNAYCDGTNPSPYGTRQDCEYASSGASCCGSCSLRCYNSGCYASCPVNCVMELAPVPECEPNCLTETVVVTQTWTTKRANANGGQGCGRPEPVLHTCSTNCLRDCTLDVRPTQCNACNASCKGSVNATVSGTFACTYSTTQPAVWGGLPCKNNTSTFDCSTTCDVDCVQMLVPKPTCTANCIDTHVTMTQSYTTAVTPQNAGKKCDPLKTHLTSTCSTICTTDCTLNTDPAFATCHPCTGNCKGAYPTLEPGTKVCKLATLTPEDKGGLPCPDPTITLACTETCCAMRAPLRDEYECPANCNRPTSTITMLYTPLNVIENVGRRCPFDRVSALEVCTLDPYEERRCGGICVVDGIPANPCARRCAAYGDSPPKGPFLATATYPVTIKYGDLSCPTETFVCNCGVKSCDLSPLPTAASPCDANCVEYDDSYAVGRYTLTYDVVNRPLNAECQTTRVLNCAKRCPCKGKVFTLAACQPTTTLSDALPWLEQGLQKATLVGLLPKCNKELYVTCATPIPLKNCESKLQCDADANSPCRCTSRLGPDYYPSGNAICSYSVLRAAQGGGQTCPAAASDRLSLPCTNLANAQNVNRGKLCPGCEYSTPALTQCVPTMIVANQAGSLEVRGTLEMTYPLINRYPQEFAPKDIPAIIPYAIPPLCTTSVSRLIAARCTSTIGLNDCYRLYQNCGPCLETRLVQLGLLFTRYGTRTCTMTDARAGVKPAACSTASELVEECTDRPTRINCSTQKYCMPCQTQCPAILFDSTTLSASQTCYFKTVTKAAYGGSLCNAVPANGVVERCKKVCSLDSAANGLPAWTSDDLFNVYIADSASGYLSNIGGRTIVCGNAVLGGYDVGADVAASVSGCDARGPMLYVGGNLMMVGSVFAAPAKIYGRCSQSNINAACGITCDIIRDECDKNAPENPANMCPALQKRVEAQSQALAGYSATASLVPLLGAPGYYVVKWGGTPIKTAKEVEVISLPANITSSVPVFSSYSVLPGEAVKKIIINVYGASVAMRGLPLRYFEEFRAITTWNFPEATELEISGMTVYGTVMAPKARVTGDALINGKLYAKSLEGTYEKSIRVQSY